MTRINLPEFASASSHLEAYISKWFDSAGSNKLNVPHSWREFARMCRIRSGNRIIPFDPYDYQVSLSEAIDLHYGTVVLKTRQLGITEAVANKFLHKACLNPAYTAAVLSLGSDETMNVARRIRRMAMSIPGFEFASDSLTSLEVKGGGRLLFRPATPNSIRSLESISDLLFDEAAFVTLIEEMYGGALPSTEMVGDDARIIIVSTPSDNVKATWYWQMLTEGLSVNIEQVCSEIKVDRLPPLQQWKTDDGWCKMIIHWKAHPVYSQHPNYLDRTKRKKKLTDNVLQREYNLGLATGVSGLFPSEAIDRSAVGGWSKKQPLHRYMACIDPSFGGSDNFQVQIWDTTAKPYSLVAEFRQKSKTKQVYLSGTLDLLDQYEPVLIAVEGNSGGALILEDLIHSRPWMRFERVNTSAQSKIVNTDRIILALERGEVTYPADSSLREELPYFAQVGSAREAIGGKNDDAVMCWAIGWAWLETVLKLSIPGTYQSAFMGGVKTGRPR